MRRSEDQHELKEDCTGTGIRVLYRQMHSLRAVLGRAFRNAQVYEVLAPHNSEHFCRSAVMGFMLPRRRLSVSARVSPLRDVDITELVAE